MGVAVTFLTSPRPVTTRILEGAGFPWEAVASRALQGQGLFSRLGTWWRLPGSIREARERLQALQPLAKFEKVICDPEGQKREQFLPAYIPSILAQFTEAFFEQGLG